MVFKYSKILIFSYSNNEMAGWVGAPFLYIFPQANIFLKNDVPFFPNFPKWGMSPSPYNKSLLKGSDREKLKGV